MIVPRVISLNVSQVQTVEWRGELVETGIYKAPVSGRLAVHGVNFDGDDQADRTVHGGVDKAVYAYAWEDYEYWRGVEAFEIAPGLFGENLTVEGLDLSSAIVGEQWRVGSAVFEVTQPRLPCYKLGIRMGDQRFLKRFMRAGRPGAYLRILHEGDVGSGDEVHVGSVPEHRVSLRRMINALRDPAEARSLRAVSRLPEFWQSVAESDGP
ncbi:MAG TPA: MOSC domain-containing protein [Gemmatimonadaceae bacterium]|jgi:MOSC domain-containing protein YiiM